MLGPSVVMKNYSFRLEFSLHLVENLDFMVQARKTRVAVAITLNYI